MQKIIKAHYTTQIEIELGTEMSFDHRRLHHHWQNVEVDNKTVQAALYRSVDDRYLSLTGLKLGEGLVLPYACSLDLQKLSFDMLRQFANTTKNPEFIAAMGTKQ